jgi:hypothetical protein
VSERIYVISAARNMQKIGIADDPPSRLLGMQTGCPLALRLVLQLETSFARRIEQEAHRLFADYRIRGEWFAVETVAAVQLVAGLLASMECSSEPKRLLVTYGPDGVGLYDCDDVTVEEELMEGAVSDGDLEDLSL